ncbi:MAG TPA: hypothetical protein H9902_06235 [Candidatus Stackebrandtia faecavium]|nr:hypothetical protein [Candidatus Stackebrandtia faecavium]
MRKRLILSLSALLTAGAVAFAAPSASADTSATQDVGIAGCSEWTGWLNAPKGGVAHPKYYGSSKPAKKFSAGKYFFDAKCKNKYGNTWYKMSPLAEQPYGGYYVYSGYVS